jgi:lysophospholipase L1-like esterase
MRKCWLKGTLFAILFILLFNGIGLVHAQSNTEIKTYQYIAFGDSVTVGYEPNIDSEANIYGFVDRLYEQALYNGRVEAVNYGILGLTSTGFKHLIQAVHDEKEMTADDIQLNLKDPRVNQMISDTPQIKSEIEEANLITITIGGNDFYHLYTEMQGMTETEFENLVHERLALLKENMNITLDLLFQLNNNVTIVITDQYQPYPEMKNETYPQLEKAKEMFTKNLNSIVTQYLEQGFDIRAAYVAEPFTNKTLEWTHIMNYDIHPNQLGYKKLAEIFAEVIWGVYHSPVKKDPIGIIVGGKELDIPYKPVIINNRTFIPVREYSEALGAEVKWDQELKSAMVLYNGITVRYNIGSDIIYIGDQEVKVSSQVELINEKTYVPLRAIAEGMGFDVKYVHKTRTAYINP